MFNLVREEMLMKASYSDVVTGKNFKVRFTVETSRRGAFLLSAYSTMFQQIALHVNANFIKTLKEILRTGKTDLPQSFSIAGYRLDYNFETDSYTIFKPVTKRIDGKDLVVSHDRHSQIPYSLFRGMAKEIIRQYRKYNTER